ncbi:MAG: branched-chain amino acid ABC transporter permease [Bacillota bacterium]|nr:branched-chain amino acid ABC transporter permease [Bacillota bacterium]
MNVKKALSVLVLEGLLYGLFLAMILIENYVIFLGLVLGTFAVILGLQKKRPDLYLNLKTILMENKKLSLVALFILLLTFPIIQAQNPYWIQVAIMAGLNVMMALGLNIMVGNAGLTCLGYAAFNAIGAYTYGILSLRYGISFWLCIPIAIVIVMVFGLVLGLPALRVKGHYLALVTIAFGLVVYQLAINLEKLTGGSNGLMNLPEPHLGSYSFNSTLDLGFVQLPFHTNYYFLVLVFVALSIWVVTHISHSLTGLTWNAMREDQLAAQCYGVNLTKNKLWAFAFGAVFGGVAGVIYAAMIGFIAPENFTYNQSIVILSMILLGGIDSIPGVIVGAIILTIVPEKFRAFADYRTMFYGVVIVLILLFKNDGLIPAHARKFTSRWRGKSERLNTDAQEQVALNGK